MRQINPVRIPLHVSSSLAVVLALVPTAITQAGSNVTWPAGSTQFVISDLHISETLTIEPGVTVLVNSGVSVIVESGGTLIAGGSARDPILFTSNGPSRWGGILFQTGSDGLIQQAIIEHTHNVGLQIQGSSPMIESSIIRDVVGDTSGAAARGIYIAGAGANPTIHACLIEAIIGANGVQGANTPAAANGANGANGTLLSNDGKPGGNGSPGGIGGTGTTGGWGYGIDLESGANADISSNHMRNIRGGNGGKGGNGGVGGDAGDGGNGYNQVGFLGNGGDGGNGGIGGAGGIGGLGGWAIAVRFLALPANTIAAQNLVQQILPGQGGLGGTAGDGGDGGYGGGGIEGPFCLDTAGGDGGNGGKGGTAGTGGLGGTARAFDSQNGGATILLVQNTAAALVVGAGGSAGLPGSGGVKGLGGGSGDCLDDGANGVNGSIGTAGQSGAVGTRNGAFAGNVALQLTNNVISFGGIGSGTALVTSGSGTITAGTNCIFGFASLSSGNVTVLAGNVLADPMFVDAANFDFHLAGSSPAIDSGNNAGVPIGLTLDFDGLQRLADGDTDGSAVVDMGAYEVPPTASPCPADISPSGGNDLVNIDDLLAVINAWGPCGEACPPHCAGDVNNTCTVNIDDLLAIINAWGACP